MSDDADAPPPPRRNPFSSMAVARITDVAESDGVDLTIETEAVRLATSYVSAYLRSDASSDHNRKPTGDVIALLGDYGTGKTHLAMRLARHASQVLRDSARAMYLDAPADRFVELYRRFMNKFGLDNVKKQVNDHYADVVAESLRHNGLTDEVVALLRNRELDPQRVVERLGLMESALLRQVRLRLRQVTGNDDFGTVLTLLLRPGFDDTVWTWLIGGNPGAVLQERGIHNPIRTDAEALEAMGVLMRLLGARGKFVLVVDELDNIFSGSDQPEQEILAAFQTFLEVTSSAGACLVISGLPDFHGLLGPSVRQRIPHKVEMTDLSTDEVREFIMRAQEAEFGRAELAPFTRETVHFLREVTGGKARNVIRTCHHVFRLADEVIQRTGNPHSPVTDDMVRMAARTLSGLVSAGNIDGEVRQVLDANGWNYQHHHYLTGDTDSKVDFWITFAGHRGGCAVLITRSILDTTDLDAPARWVTAIRGAATDIEVIVVVNGVLTDPMNTRLRESHGCEPLVYVEHGFAEAFRALLGMVSNRLVRDADPDPLAAVAQQVDQIGRQQSNLYTVVEQLRDQVDRMRSTSDRKLTALQSEWSHVLRTAVSPASARTESVESLAALDLPREVAGLFAEAVDALDELTEFDVMLSDAFDERQARTWERIQRRLRTESYFTALGIAAMARTTVLTFRTAVAEWYDRERSAGASAWRPSRTAEAGLDALCRTFDDITEFVPLFQLAPLFELPPWTVADGVGGDAGRQARRRRVLAALDNFGLRVRQAVLRSVMTTGT